MTGKFFLSLLMLQIESAKKLERFQDVGGISTKITVLESGINSVLCSTQGELFGWVVNVVLLEMELIGHFSKEDKQTRAKISGIGRTYSFTSMKRKKK